MKKYIIPIIMFAVSVTAFALSLTANFKLNVCADYYEYARVITQDTPFYSDKLGKKLLFYLPYTYYVRVIREEDEFLHVECYGTEGTAAIDGYVPSDMLFHDGLSVRNPYAAVKITAGSTAVLYADADLQTTVQYIFEGRTMQLYGILPNLHDTLYYVSYNGRLGYVKEADVLPFTIPNHPNELTFLTPEPVPNDPSASDETPAEETNGNSVNTERTLRILIISSLLFAGVIALVIAFKRKPDKRAAAGYYDENDYE